MSYLDKEIERLKYYCKGLGIKLIFSSRTDSDNLATWSAAPQEIVVYNKTHKTKTEIILSMLHELAHNCYYMHNNKPDIPDAYTLEASRKKNDPPINKSERKKILDYERSGIAYMNTIAVELNLKIPLWKVDMAAEFDLWMYEYYYETGRFPTMKQKIEKKKELVMKHKGT